MKFTKTRTKHTQAGFTLVELVIVMAVIGVAISGVLYYQNKDATIADTYTVDDTLIGTTVPMSGPAGTAG